MTGGVHADTSADGAEVDDAAAAPEAGVGSTPRRWSRADHLVLVGTWALLVLPLVVALAAQHSPRWFPIADLAQSELRIRDVGGRHTPLMGLAGRIGDYYDAGSHPGPLSFWLLAPVYRLLGATSFAYMASTVVLHSLAFGLALWLARRRGGTPLVVALGALLALVSRYYGPAVFFEGWNPYLPVSWWVVVLLAVWSVLEDDLVALPILVVAGSVCAQTHLPYVGMVGGMGAPLVVAFVLAVRSRRRVGGEGLGRLLRWTGGSVALGVALWIPPVIDQLWGTGNGTKIIDSLRHPAEPVAGVRAGVKEILYNLDVTELFGGHVTVGATTPGRHWWPALVVLAAWAAAAVASWRLGHRALQRLHLVVGVGLVLAVVSASKVAGQLWYYLFLWAWGLLALLLLATAWTAAELLRTLLPASPRSLLRPVATALAAVVLVVGSASFALDNRDALPSRPDLTGALGELSVQVVPALEQPGALGGGHDGRYLVRWIDPITIGSQGIGLVNELERQGFDVGVDPGFGAGAVRYRVLAPGEATGLLQLVVGPAIEEWDARPDTTRIAFVDTRSDAARAEYARLDASIAGRLRALGRDDLARSWAANLFVAALDPDVPADIRDDMIRVLDIGGPAAVYLTAPPTPA